MLPDRPDPSTPNELSGAELTFLQSLERQLAAQDVELRSAERHALAVEVHLSALDREPIQGRTVDISRSGLRAMFNGVPEVGMHYAVYIFGLQAEPVRTLGRCLRLALRDDGRCEAVLHFSHPLPKGGVLG